MQRGILAGVLIAGLAALAAAPRAAATPAPGGAKATATFAGGCFWCMVHPFDQLPGVISVTSGYSGGTKDHPTYEEVSAGGTGHAESVQVVYDPARVTYEKLLDVYWHNIDPFARESQFCDHGHQYRSVIFYHDAAQKQLAEATKVAWEKKLGKPIATEIVAYTKFWPAEDYHQDYYKKNPLRYKYYRYSCGRDQRLEQVWGKKTGE